MSAFLIQGLVHLFGLLPLRINQAAGTLLGHIAWLGKTTPRRIVETNLSLCFPDMPEQQRRQLAHQSLLETGKQLTECAWIWHRPNRDVSRKILEVRGQEHLENTAESDRGLMFVTPHIGNWELCLLPLSRERSLTYFFRAPRNSSLAPLLVKWRGHLGGQPASLDASGIREGLRKLKNGEAIGILPDQEPDSANGVYAPFYDQPALTMTLLSRLARRTDSLIFFVVMERLPKARGWRLHILPGDETLASDELSVATASLNKHVEQCIALCPAQYLWNYKRFNTLEDGSRRDYR